MLENNEFNATACLEEIKQERALRKKSGQYRTSKLDKFGFELTQLKQAGANISELNYFLKKNKINVTWNTVNNWINKHGKF